MKSKSKLGSKLLAAIVSANSKRVTKAVNSMIERRMSEILFHLSEDLKQDNVDSKDFALSVMSSKLKALCKSLS